MTYDVSQTQVSLNVDEAREWLEIVYGDTPGLTHICSTADWRGRFFAHDETEQALAYIQALDARKVEGIYARACTVRSAPQEGRGGDELSFYLPGLWGDIDIAGPGHKTKQALPPSIEEAQRIVFISGLPEPSHWVHSGGGLYPWWLLKDPHLIDDLEDVRALSAGWQQALRRAAELAGYHYGSGVGDLSRVLRVPGTVNRKEGLERPCTALEGWGWSGKLYAFDELVDALAAVTPAPPPPRPIEAKFNSAQHGERPGDEFNRTADWQDLLLPEGWQWVRRMGDHWYLRRPGKMSGGHSATLRVSTDRLWVFSEEAAPFEPFKLYDKFSAYALLKHGGDFAAAARELRAKGYGDQSVGVASVPTAVPMEHVLHPHTPPPSGPDNAPPAQGAVAQSAADAYGIPLYGDEQLAYMRWDGISVARKWVELHGDSFVYAADQKEWMRWAGHRWEVDSRLRHEYSAVVMVERLLEYAARVKAQNPELGAAVEKDAKKLSHANQIQAMLRNARSDPRVAVCREDFDKDPNLVTLRNGVLNLSTLQLQPHDPKLMLTRMMNASFAPDAGPGRWERFVAEVLPDEQVRAYVQRLCGYMLTGRMTERALVLFYGESGTGKTQFLEALREVMGDFAGVAPPSAFQPRQAGYKGPSEDLHKLMGKRFVMQSELDAGTRFNEALVKSIVGADTQTTRPLYGAPIDWQPEYTVFLATNHLPRINSAENAIWNRVKPVKFDQVFIDAQGQALNPGDKNLGRRMAREEPEKILNWLLAGLLAYQEQGLDEPQQVTQWLQEYREDVDTARQFIHEGPEHGRTELVAEGESPVRAVYQAYLGWAEDNGVRPLGMRGFNERLSSMGFEKRKRERGMMWQGIKIDPHGQGQVAAQLSSRRNNTWVPLRQ